MTKRRVGLWLVGAFGGVGSTLTLGLSALSRELSEHSGLTTSLPMFDGLELPAFSDFVVGGHEIRRGSFEESLDELWRESRVFDLKLLDACRDDLVAASARVRPGTILGAGPAVERLSDWREAKVAKTTAPSGRSNCRRPRRIRQSRGRRPPHRPQRLQHRAAFRAWRDASKPEVSRNRARRR